jgi:hypothetical protein
MFAAGVLRQDVVGVIRRAVGITTASRIAMRKVTLQITHGSGTTRGTGRGEDSGAADGARRTAGTGSGAGAITR